MQHGGILRIGTRGSKLALAQAEEVRRRLAQAHGWPLDALQIVSITTTGDRVLNRPLSEIGGKGLFTKEIEESLLDGSVDLAVHSMKDMPTELPPGLSIPCILEREDPRDAFISTNYESLGTLPQGATVGTSSLRRKIQLLSVRPDLKIIDFRGNVTTRLRKLDEGIADATLLAVAGLKRLSMEHVITHALSTETFLPAVAQGAIGIEIREGDQRVQDFLSPLHHQPTAIAITAERAFLAELEGNCRTPIAAHATIDGTTLILHGSRAEPDGSNLRRDVITGPLTDAATMGRELGEQIKSLCALG